MFGTPKHSSTFIQLVPHGCIRGSVHQEADDDDIGDVGPEIHVDDVHLVEELGGLRVVAIDVVRGTE